jgi:hypothetical protein
MERIDMMKDVKGGPVSDTLDYVNLIFIVSRESQEPFLLDPRNKRMLTLKIANKDGNNTGFINYRARP